MPRQKQCECTKVGELMPKSASGGRRKNLVRNLHECFMWKVDEAARRAAMETRRGGDGDADSIGGEAAA